MIGTCIGAGSRASRCGGRVVENGCVECEVVDGGGGGGGGLSISVVGDEKSR